ncbi:hypothetical protein BDZ91DRAFT_852421 [Kalaharituber pfeilii]|nr:hypothetical protein BDZ91DRAFT_852421 [Kalaharituber pfeilii]
MPRPAHRQNPACYPGTPRPPSPSSTASFLRLPNPLSKPQAAITGGVAGQSRHDFPHRRVHLHLPTKSALGRSPEEWSLHHTHTFLTSAGDGVDPTTAKDSNPTGRITAHLVPTTQGNLSALKVLRYLLLPNPPLYAPAYNAQIRGTTPLSDSTLEDTMRLIGSSAHMSSLPESTGSPLGTRIGFVKDER